MNILFTTAEAVPFAKTGGLADVVGSLPKALRAMDIDARVVMPFYAFINYERFELQHLFSFQFPRRTGTVEVHIHHATYDEVPFYFIQGWPYFGQEAQVYDGWVMDIDRFTFFSQASLALAWELKQREGWFPDLFHTNDWHTGLIPFLIKNSAASPDWARVGSMMTIHNIAYQGNQAGHWLYEQGIPARGQPDLVYQDLTDNLLAIGIGYADHITTVSPRYAIEIRYPYMGYALDGLIRRRADAVSGILNGIDLAVWNPETDPVIHTHYNAQTFAEKRADNKRELQYRCGLPIRDDVPIIGMVTRLDRQKGLDLAVPALRSVLANSEVQFVGLGTGDPQFNHMMWQLGQDFHWKARTYVQHDADLAHYIYAGCDIFLMPSYYEPCGIGQMIAMRYGALPLVRETGGLADTVTNYDNGQAETGTGFVFNWTEVDALINTIYWAMDTYYNKHIAWQRMQARAMQIDFSWDSSARQYADLYRQIIGSLRQEQTS